MRIGNEEISIFPNVYINGSEFEEKVISGINSNGCIIHVVHTDTSHEFYTGSFQTAQAAWESACNHFNPLDKDYVVRDYRITKFLARTVDWHGRPIDTDIRIEVFRR